MDENRAGELTVSLSASGGKVQCLLAFYPVSIPGCKIDAPHDHRKMPKAGHALTRHSDGAPCLARLFSDKLSGSWHCSPPALLRNKQNKQKLNIHNAELVSETESSISDFLWMLSVYHSLVLNSYLKGCMCSNVYVLLSVGPGGN